MSVEAIPVQALALLHAQVEWIPDLSLSLSLSLSLTHILLLFTLSLFGL